MKTISPSVWYIAFFQGWVQFVQNFCWLLFPCFLFSLQFGIKLCSISFVCLLKLSVKCVANKVWYNYCSASLDCELCWASIHRLLECVSNNLHSNVHLTNYMQSTRLKPYFPTVLCIQNRKWSVQTFCHNSSSKFW